MSVQMTVEDRSYFQSWREDFGIRRQLSPQTCRP